MKIKVIHDPPQELIRVATIHFEDCPIIKETVFGAGIISDGATGVFLPKEGMILIDLANCINNRMFTLMGMLLLPNIWFNMLWALFHEYGHAIQLEGDESLVEHEKLPPAYEEDADKFAKGMVYEWAEANQVPTLAEMGWAKISIENLINNWYALPMGDKLLTELDATERGAAAELSHFASIQKLNNVDQLESEIDNETLGIKINDDRYLTAVEFLGTGFKISE